jgi:hypothetical protein
MTARRQGTTICSLPLPVILATKTVSLRVLSVDRRQMSLLPRHKIPDISPPYNVFMSPLFSFRALGVLNITAHS